MARMYNLAMQFERELHLGAGRYERTDDRRGYANGYKPKTLKTHAGELTLQIPQVRDSETPFYPRSLERGTRYERALKLAVAEMYVRGVSTRKVQAIFDKLCDVNITAEQVSRAMQAMDEELEAWRNRPIGEVKVLFVDATYHKARVNGVVVSVATFIVAGILGDGHRAILAVDTDLSENEVHWRNVLSGLIKRGMHGVKLIVSDSHDGLRAAREATLPGIPWQRCQMHLQQNAQAHITKAHLKAEVAEDIRAIFHAGSIEEAQRLLALAVEKYSKCQAKLAAWMEDNIPEGFTVFAFPPVVRQFLRTNNMEEKPQQANQITNTPYSRIPECCISYETRQRHLRRDQRRLGIRSLQVYVRHQGSMSTVRIYKKNPCIVIQQSHATYLYHIFTQPHPRLLPYFI